VLDCRRKLKMSVVVKEILCYIQNNVDKFARTLVSSAVNSFYTDEEVLAAKQCMYSCLENLDVDGLPRFIKRNPGDGKRKLQCEDILNLFVFADGRQTALPIFVAAKLDRVPTVSPGDVDIYALAASVSSLTSQLESVTKKLDVAVTRSEYESVIKRLDTHELNASTNNINFPPLSNSTASVVSQPLAQGSTWASAADGDINKRKPVIRVCVANLSSKIKAAPRRKIISAFVGQLDNSTSEDDLVEMLSEAGVNVKCSKLKPKPDTTWTTAAFYVLCDEDSRDGFFDEAIWPEGAELRDWYFK